MYSCNDWNCGLLTTGRLEVSVAMKASANIVASGRSGVALLGLLILAIVRERYAVRIATAEGEKNAVVSDKKEYIAQIVNALDDAFHNNIHPLSARGHAS